MSRTRLRARLGAMASVWARAGLGGEKAEPSRRAVARRRGKGIDLDLNERVLGARTA